MLHLHAILHHPLIHQIGQMLLALLLGGLVGWERERHERPAGFKTHILVCLGAALMAILDSRSPSVGGRIAAQVVTGVGFLGAGTILRDPAGGPVRGLTTAASLWAVAGIGLAVGTGGEYAALAAAATGIVLLTLTIISRLESRMVGRRRRQELNVLLGTDHDPLAAIGRLLETLRSQNVKTRDLRLETTGETQMAHLQISLPRHTHRDAMEPHLRGTAGVVHFDWAD